MTSRLLSRGCVAVLIASFCGALTGFVRAAAPDVGTEAQREAGKKLYLNYCSQCHGEKGDGEGYAAHICGRGHATSRRASSRFGRLRTERSRRIRTS